MRYNERASSCEPRKRSADGGGDEDWDHVGVIQFFQLTKRGLNPCWVTTFITTPNLHKETKMAEPRASRPRHEFSHQCSSDPTDTVGGRRCPTATTY